MTLWSNIAKFCHCIVAQGDRGSTMEWDAKRLVNGVSNKNKKVGMFLANYIRKTDTHDITIDSVKPETPYEQFRFSIKSH